MIRANADKTGKHFGFAFCTFMAVEFVNFREVYGDWNTAFENCVDLTIVGVVMTGGVGLYTDGFHFQGCQRVEISDCDIDCGDDCLSFTQSGQGTHDMADIVVSNCNLWSRLANVIKVEINNPYWSIRDITFSNLTGRVGTNGSSGSGVIVQVISGEGGISHIEIDGLLLRAAQGAGAIVKIKNAANIRIARLNAPIPKGKITIDGASNVDLIDCIVDLPQATGAQCVLAAAESSCFNLRIIGGTYRNSKQHAIQLGGGETTAVNGFQIIGALIQGSAGAAYGIHLFRANNGVVSANTIQGFPGWGIYEQAANCSNNLYLGNRLFNNGTSTPQAISFGANNNSKAIRNVAEAGVQLQDSGGFRDSVDGWTISTNDPTNTELIRNGATKTYRFRSARKGSITGLAVQSTGAITGTGTSYGVSISVFKNTTGTAGAALGSCTNTFFSVSLFNSGMTPPPLSAVKTQAQDLTAFQAGDELLLVFSKTGSITSTTELRCSFEVQI